MNEDIDELVTIRSYEQRGSGFATISRASFSASTNPRDKARTTVTRSRQQSGHGTGVDFRLLVWSGSRKQEGEFVCL